MTCTIYLEHITPDGKRIENKEVYVLIQKIINSINAIKYVWLHLNSESFDDSKTFEDEEEAKQDIFKAYTGINEIYGDKVKGISFDYTKGIKDIK